MRMPKGWVLVGTNAVEFGRNVTRAERMKRDHVGNMMLRKIKTKKEEDLVKESLDEAVKADKRKENLLNAYKEKKLKSKALIKEVREMRKASSKVTLDES